MSPLLWLLRSSKAELKIAASVLGVLFAIPLIAVVVIANAGVLAVSSALAAINPITHLVSIFDANGKQTAQLSVSTVWPVNGVVTLEFGQPDPPYQEHHTGIDIANPNRHIGDPITPFMAGRVIFAGWDNGYGNYVMIDHGHDITSLYGHMSQLNATKGQEVKPGDIIGLEGESGHATGPHVHFEMRVYGIPVNPRIFMVGDPARGPGL